MAVLDDVKILLDISYGESGLDEKLDLIIKNAERQVLLRLPEDISKVPDDLAYIVCEVSVARFNRLGNEGMSSYAQDGESFSLDDSHDIDAFNSDIQRWISRREGKKIGVVRFL